ncbi:class I SAM-dependent methyltransferase [Acinetobacter puyangensis]|uniref:class I SAM-dependent methyltransferase n=1 Tax=Acinetobacter puyangensis TaxID=1096779 RepID=UPI003A4D8150
MTQSHLSKPLLSKHRHISFTAHYTGYRWYMMGISHPAFATTQGKFLTGLLQPIEAGAERFIGGSIRTTLQQRHTLIDATLVDLLVQHPNLQVIEIATGLSPRGWHFRKHYPGLTYIEVDLPNMARIKKQALQKAGQPDAQVLAIDLFTPQIQDMFEHLDRAAPLVIISEGLVNYFDKAALKTLWTSLAEYGREFDHFYYLTDLCPEPVQHPLANLIWNSSKLLKFLSRSAFSFHFTTPDEVQDFFLNCGYHQVSLQQPSQKDHKPSTIHFGDFVWVVLAEI